MNNWHPLPLKKTKTKQQQINQKGKKIIGLRVNLELKI